MTTLHAQPSLKHDDFRRILQAYQQATERLKDSHDQLMAEVSRLRAELVAKNQQFERRKRLAALGEMAAGVAHEIRNPLGSISLYADLLVRQLRSEPNKALLASKIGTAVRGLDAIVEGMLTFTRDTEAIRQPTRLSDLVAEAAAESADRLESAGVTLRAGQIDPGMIVELDGRLFKRILVNLMINAADAMAGEEAVGRWGDGAMGRQVEEGRRDAETTGRGEEGIANCKLQEESDRLAATRSPAGTKGSAFPARDLTITCDQLPPGDERGRWRIQVMDSGPGIAPDVVEKIFHPFFTTKSHGTGLGLAIVHHMVEAHGGTIAAANRPEGGAVFTILLP